MPDLEHLKVGSTTYDIKDPTKVSNVGYDTTNKAITKTLNGVTTQVVTASDIIGADVGEAVTDWLDEHCADSETVGIDDTLTIHHAAADAKSTGDRIGELVEVSDTTPESTWNKVWVKETVNDDVVVPTNTELQGVEALIAPPFDQNANYAAGSYVTRTVSGVEKLYRFTSAHTGIWTGTDAVETKVGNDISDVKSAINDRIFPDGLVLNHILNNDGSITYDKNYYVTPFLEFGGGSFGWYAGATNQSACLVAYNANFEKVDAWNAYTNSLISRSDLPSTYAYLRLCGNYSHDTVLYVNNVITWDSRGHNYKTALAEALRMETKIEGVDIALHSFDNQLGNEPLAMSPGYISTYTTPVDITDVQDISGEFRHCVVSCSEGDIFTINAHGGSVPLAWAFINSDGTTLIEKSGYGENVSNFEKVAPAGSAYLIINDNFGKTSYKGVYIYKKLNEVASFGEVAKKNNDALSYLQSNVLTTITESMKNNGVVTSAGWIYNAGKHTDMLFIKPYTDITVVSSGLDSSGAILAFYNEKGEFLQDLTIPGDGTSNKTVNVDLTESQYGKAYYVIASTYTNASSSYITLSNDNSAPETSSYLYHKKFCGLGDSITDGDGNNNWSWYDMLLDRFDSTSISLNFALSEQCMRTMADRCTPENMADIDICFVMGGTNQLSNYRLGTKDDRPTPDRWKPNTSYSVGDWVQGGTLEQHGSHAGQTAFAYLYWYECIGAGTSSSNTDASGFSTTLNDEFTDGTVTWKCMGNPSWYSDLKGVAQKIYSCNPHIRLIWLVPIKTKADIGNSPSVWTKAEKFEAIREFCTDYSIQMIDLQKEFPLNQWTKDAIMHDNLHPNEYGYKLMEKIICGHIGF